MAERGTEKKLTSDGEEKPKPKPKLTLSFLKKKPRSKPPDGEGQNNKIILKIPESTAYHDDGPNLRLNFNEELLPKKIESINMDVSLNEI